MKFVRPTTLRINPFYIHLLMIIYAAIVGWAIYQYVIVPSGHFGWDQAGRASRGVLIARDIHDGDWLSLLYDIYRQVYWPPVYTVLLGISFLLFGESPLVGRTLTLVLFIFGAFLLYRAGLSLGKQTLVQGKRNLADSGKENENEDEHSSESIAWIATILFLSTSALILLAGQVMLEIPALLFLNLTILIYFGIDGKSSIWSYVALGLCVVVTYLTKINYGVLLLIVLGIDRIWASRLRPSQLFTRTNWALFFSILVPFALWFAYPPKLERTWSTLVNMPFGTQDRFSLEALLDYPLGFVTLVDNKLFLFLIIVGFVAVLSHLGNRKIRFLILIILVQFLLVEFHQVKGIYRHLIPVFPPLFLCIGYALSIQTLSFNRSVWSVATALLTLTALFLSPVMLIDSLRPISVHHDRTTLSAITEAIESNDMPLVIGTLNLTDPTPTLLDWVLITETDLLQPVHSDVVMNYEQDPKIQDLVGRIGLPTSLKERLTAVAARSERPGRARTIHLGHSPTGYSQSSEQLKQYLLKSHAAEQFNSIIVVIPVEPAKGFSPLWQEPFTLDFITPAVDALGFTHASSQIFETKNTRIEIYQ